MAVYLKLFPAALFLFILPFNHSIALRLTSLAVAAVIAAMSWREAKLPMPPKPLLVALGSWITLSCASLTWSVNADMTHQELINEIGYTTIAFCVFLTMGKTQQHFDFFINALVAGSMAILTVALVGTPLVPSQWNSDTYAGGVGGFSTYIAMILPIVLYRLISARKLAIKIGCFLLIVGLLYGALLTLNRAFWLVLSAETTVFCLLALYRSNLSRRKKAWSTGGIAALALIVAAPIVAVNGYKYGTNDLASALTTFTGDIRIDSWEKILVLTESHPWLGSGFGRYALKHAYSNSGLDPVFLHAHNLLLDYVVQLGLVGLVAFTTLLLLLARYFWQLYRTTASPQLALLAAVTLTFMLGTISKNMTDDFFHRDVSLLFWSVLGLVMGFGLRQSARTN